MKQFFKFMFASMLGFFISLLILFFIFFIIIASIVSLSSKETSIPAKSVLILKLDEPVVERSSESPFSNLPVDGFKYLTNIGLYDIIKDIHKAETDPNISGIFLDLSNMVINMGTLEEIREALLQFKKSGKFVVSFADYYSQRSYYLATVSDKVFLHPVGMFEWKGLAAELMFFKGTLSKLDVEMQVIRHGKFKSAVEPLISDKMSPENKEQTLAFIQSFWEHMVTKVAEARKIKVEDLNRLADELALEKPEDALKNGLVDSLTYRDGVIAWMQKKLGISASTKINYVGIRAYNEVPSTVKKEHTKDKIAVIFASGDINEGEGSEESIGAERIARAIRKARNDENIKAIVFRVNSPGGVMVSSDVIWREVQLAKKQKPVVASFGDFAASGGYYISCDASKIVAQPTTITGSIGVFAVIPNMQKMLNNKLGVTTDGVMTHKNSDFITVLKPLSEYQKALLTRDVERSYQIFVSRVALGRKLTPEMVDSIGQGRVWSGVTAKRLGLVDELGGLNKAIEVAAGLAKLEKYRLVELPAQKDPFTTMIEQLSGNYQEEAAIREKLGAYYPYYRQLMELKKLEGIQARMPFTFSVN
ncbi:MAG: signal peptide peptidase SppA [Bacteroidales bacterium]